MKLSLSRWEDEHGDSAGYWLVRELPGFFLERSLEGSWQVQCLDFPVDAPLAGTVMQAPCDLWGVDWSPRTDLYLTLPDGLVGPFPSRVSALFALENHLTPASSSVVGTLL